MKKQFKGLLLIALLILIPIGGSLAQQAYRIRSSALFDGGEVLKYKISFRWGILRGKLAEVTYTSGVASKDQYFSQLTMRTTGMAETFYPMRDTMETLYGANKLPRRFEKRIDDNGYKAQDILTFSYNDRNVRVQSKQFVNGDVMLDTTLLLNQSNVEVVDLLSTLALLRTYDFVNLDKTEGKSVKALIPLEREQHLVEYRFGGVETLQMPDGTKRQTMKIFINVNDENFKKKRNSVTIWLTRDKAQIPVKITSDLSIGSVVINLVSYNKR